MDLAKHISSWSKDPKTKVGCVIVGSKNKELRSIGYNGLVRGFDDSKTEYYQKPLKNSFVEHAETNAVFNAARIGVSLEGCFLFCTHFMCQSCSRSIIQSGMSTAVVLESKCNLEFRKSNALEIQQSKTILNNNNFKLVILSEEEEKINSLSFDPQPAEESFITRIFV